MGTDYISDAKLIAITSPHNEWPLYLTNFRSGTKVIFLRYIIIPCSCSIICAPDLGWDECGLLIAHFSYIFTSTTTRNSNEMHFEIQKSILKSKNPMCNPKWNIVNFKISYAKTQPGGALVKYWHGKLSTWLQVKWAYSSNRRISFV